MCICVYVCVYVYVYISIALSLCVYMYMYVCIYIYICICVNERPLHVGEVGLALRPLSEGLRPVLLVVADGHGFHALY